MHKTNNDFHDGQKVVDRRRFEWDLFANKARPILDKVAVEAHQNKYYENLYVIDKRPYTIETWNNSFICLFFGSHPIGIAKEEIVPETRKKRFSLTSESGGALYFSQMPAGEVAVIVIPSTSDILKPEESFLIYRIFTNPYAVEEKHIIGAVNFFLRYSFVTSYAGKPNLYDRFRISYIKIKMKFTLDNVVKEVISKIIEVASIFLNPTSFK